MNLCRYLIIDGFAPGAYKKVWFHKQSAGFNPWDSAYEQLLAEPDCISLLPNNFIIESQFPPTPKSQTTGKRFQSRKEGDNMPS